MICFSLIQLIYFRNNGDSLVSVSTGFFSSRLFKIFIVTSVLCVVSTVIVLPVVFTHSTSNSSSISSSAGTATTVTVTIGTATTGTTTTGLATAGSTTVTTTSKHKKKRLRDASM